MKHTPGPWIGVDNNGKFNSDHSWTAEDDGACCSEAAPIWAGDRVVALVVHSSDLLSLRSHPSVTANAHLIAAAPDLLEALKKCASVCAGETMSKSGLISALESARAAIAKATGEKA